MANTPNFITVEQFNKAVADWGKKIRDKAKRNAPVGADSLSESEKLRPTVKSSMKKTFGVASQVAFGFEPQGIYVHYGVGRGYKREGGKVVRYAKKEKTLKAKSGKTYTYKRANSRPVHDWLDVEIRRGIKELADIAQAYLGDDSQKKLLEMAERMTIERKK